MARLRRLMLPSYPYHLIQRGNRRMQTLFEAATTSSIAICWPTLGRFPLEPPG